jgi:hypothetical protein
MQSPFRFRRAAAALVGAALLVAGAAGASASGPDVTNGAPASRPDVALADPAFPPGSSLQFVAVTPCRIADTRVTGGALVAGQRVFDATLATYATQGGKAGSCGLPTGSAVASVQLNLGAISQNNKTSDIKGWATGTTEPTASLVNYNPSGPVANMVTVPVNASGQFTLKTPGAAHTFIDVAGFYVKPAYAFVNANGTIKQNAASGVVSITHPSTGRYNITFDRDITQCAISTASLEWAVATDVSPDSQAVVGIPDQVRVGAVNSAGTFVDLEFYILLSC